VHASCRKLQFAICILFFAIAGPLLAQDASSLDAREEDSLKAAAESVAPSVVQIRTIGGFDSLEGTQFTDGPTTGLIISLDGYIISSAFNFAQQPASILISFASGKQAPAELVATDHSRMLVLLKVNGASDLSVPTMAPMDEIHPGQWAVAVGRTFRADKTNVTVGIVSALGRMFGRAIQTDADVSLANYGGPLVDVRGRVLGVIVPMAPQQGATEIAGTEWYDSGIGFAVPLGGLADRIEKMKKGEDQRPGLLGIGMAPKNPHSTPADLVSVRPDSPAGQAGLKKGDRIVELNGKPIKTQTALRFALGTAYGGDEVRVTAMRGKERLERTIKLAGELPPYRHPFLGVLPVRPPIEPPAAADKKAGTDNNKNADTDKKESDTKSDSEDKAASADKKKADSTEKGVAVRFVYGGSPAAEAGIQIGDRITQINESKVDSIDDAIAAVNNLASGNKTKVKLTRDGQPKDFEVTLTKLPTNVPTELPAAVGPQPGDAKTPAAEARDLKLPEFANKCRVYVSASHEAGQPQAAILWLQSPTEKPDDVIAAWQAICDRDGIILVVPSPTGKDQWERPELEYLRRLSEHIVAQYKIDPHRLVAYGNGKGGTITWPLALASRDIFRGIVTAATPLPRPPRVPPNEPSLRFAVFAALPSSKDSATPISLCLRKFSDAGYNVATITTASPTSQLTDDERNQIARWIDTLDRF
jgi:S1-C subfamily serine protease